MCRKLIYLLSFAVLLIAASSVQALIEITTAVGGGADTTLSNDADKGPNVIHGALGTVRLRDYPGTRAKIGFIRFDLTGIAGDLTGATLSLNFTTAYAKTWNVYGLKDGANDLWPEATTNYNNAPGFIPNPPTTLGNWAFTDPPQTVLLGTFDIPAGAGYYTSSTTKLNMDTFLNSDTNKRVTLVIIGQGSGNTNDNYFSTKESTTPGPSFAPKLTFSLSQLKANASGPSPADKATDMPRDVTLSWTPGQYVGALSPKHKIYFSDDFNDVNINVGGVTQDPNYYPTVGALNLGFSKTYYWRVDEANSTIGWDRGNIWQFTVEPASYQLPGSSIISATASSSSDANMVPGKTIDGSGLNSSDQHSTVRTNMWLSSVTGPQPTWIQYEFGKVYKLHQMWVWNYNGESILTKFGLRNVTIQYSTDNTNWTQLSGVPEFTQATGLATYVHTTEIAFGDVAAKYVRITANSNWGGVGYDQYGLSEVRFFSIPVYAREPNPTNGQTDAALDAALRWRAGREAAMHKLYFSTNRQYVADGAVTPIIIPGSGSYANYGPLSLNLGDTYYWKVNEVNDAATPATWQGDVWSFTTIAYTTVDNFEDYNNYTPDRIWENWIDGWGTQDPPPGIPGNGTGSTVGYTNPPFAETRAAFVRSGTQSMPFDYNNTKPPYYSQADHTFDTPQNWTGFGIKALTLWLKGIPAAFLETSPGVFFTSGTGTDIYGTADEGRFIYKQLTGNGTIIARVDSLDNTHAWAKAGVMIRETLDAGSSYAYVMWAQLNGVRFQARLSTGTGATSDTSVATPEQIAIRAPAWVKLERNGNQFNGYYATDAAGTVWTPMVWNPQTITMTSNVYIGLAVTSHVSGVVAGASFSSVSTTGGVTGDWQLADLGVAQTTGGNKPDTLYVMVEDSTGGKNVVTHSDPNIALRSTWQQWNIPLKTFRDGGVSLNSVKKMHIGVGNKTLGGAGSLYFDDIRLYPPRCFPDLIKPAGDFNNDCVVDYPDLAILAGQWLGGTGLTADLNADSSVDFKDYALLADMWLEELLWPQ